jgi:hypothetical protein
MDTKQPAAARNLKLSKETEKQLEGMKLPF